MKATKTMNQLLKIVAASGLLAVPAWAGEETKTIELAFVTHIEAGMTEQDVFIEREPGSGKVYRVTAGDHDLSAPLFASAKAIAHNPFDPTAVGPYPKGDALGVTLGQWLKTAGRGTYSYRDGEGRLDLRFSGLVPNGLYTMWIVFSPVSPPKPFTGTLDLPLGAGDGSESSFRADADGAATFTHTFKPGLQFSDVWTNTMLGVCYHRDGKTHGGSAGPFGLHSHVPIFVKLPKREGLE